MHAWSCAESDRYAACELWRFAIKVLAKRASHCHATDLIANVLRLESLLTLVHDNAEHLFGHKARLSPTRFLGGRQSLHRRSCVAHRVTTAGRCGLQVAGACWAVTTDHCEWPMRDCSHCNCRYCLMSRHPLSPSSVWRSFIYRGAAVWTLFTLSVHCWCCCWREVNEERRCSTTHTSTALMVRKHFYIRLFSVLFRCLIKHTNTQRIAIAVAAFSVLQLNRSI